MKKIRLFTFEKECEDEYGKWVWYFHINLILNIHYVFTINIDTNDFSVCNRSFIKCLKSALSHIEENCPRYYRLRENVKGY